MMARVENSAVVITCHSVELVLPRFGVVRDRRVPSRIFGILCLSPCYIMIFDEWQVEISKLALVIYRDL